MIDLRATLADARRFVRLYDQVYGAPEPTPAQWWPEQFALPDWRILRRLAARAEPPLRRAWTKAVAAALNGSVQQAIESRLEVGDLDGAVAAIPWDQAATPVIRDELMATFVDTYTAAGNAALRVLPAKTRFPFAIVDNRALEWIRRHGAELVDDFGVQSHEGLRGALDSMMRDGLTPQQAASMIREHVGLSRPFSEAVENMRLRLAKAGDPRLEAKVAKYAKDLQQVRTISIGRTEAQHATNGGQHESILEAADKGLLDRDRARRRLRTAGDDEVRDTHEVMEGQTVGLEEPFIVVEKDGTQREVMHPPLDVNCRCGVEILPEGE